MKKMYVMFLLITNSNLLFPMKHPTDREIYASLRARAEESVGNVKIITTLNDESIQEQTLEFRKDVNSDNVLTKKPCDTSYKDKIKEIYALISIHEKFKAFGFYEDYLNQIKKILYDLFPEVEITMATPYEHG